MADRRHNLALETSGHAASVVLGHGDELLATFTLSKKRRHHLDLMTGVDHLCREHAVAPAGIGEVYLALGPGSFTGLRVAVATAKMLALTLGGKIVGVPTLDVLRAQHPEAMVCLNVKRGTAWCAGPDHEPALRPLEEIEALGLPLVADTLDGATPAEPDPGVLWRLGRTAAKAGRYDDPLTLAPLYIREPEAVTLWDQRLGNQKSSIQNQK
jgi:tRNA threonylcarbamoyl adenosine modification protein YeaZ